MGDVDKAEHSSTWIIIAIMMRVAEQGMCLWGRVEDLLYGSVRYRQSSNKVFIFILQQYAVIN